RAREARLEAIRSALGQGKPAQALDMLDHWASMLDNGEDVAEIRAQAFDARVLECSDAPCRYAAARAAAAARATTERRAAAERTRSSLLEALATGKPAQEDLTAQVKSLRELSRLAEATKSAAADDAEIVARADAAIAWTGAERSKIALIGAPVAVVDDIL